MTTLASPGRSARQRGADRTAPAHAMAAFWSHSWLLTVRYLRTLARQPVYLAFNLVQPIVWLLLFGQLFTRVADLPGFGATSYLVYLTPGVVVMTAVFSAGWAGTSFIQDMDRGVMDRNLTSPLSRGAMIAGSLAYQAVTTIIQSLIVFGVGYVAGARYAGGWSGIVVVLVCATLLALTFAAFSDAIALLVRQQEALIGVSQFLSLPLTFLSSVMISPALMPGWVDVAARFNPIDWAAVASREAMNGAPDWSAVVTRVGGLGLLALVMAWLAARAFRTYQRSV